MKGFKLGHGTICRWLLDGPVLVLLHWMTSTCSILLPMCCLSPLLFPSSAVSSQDGNVLFEYLDEDGCPQGIKLADFGLSHPINTPLNKYLGTELAFHIRPAEPLRRAR